MKLKLLDRPRRSREVEYLEQSTEREETERIRDKFKDEASKADRPR
jgi:hypothetical protein